MSTIRALVIFPYMLGGDEQENKKMLGILKQILDAVRNPRFQLHNNEAPPILFVNRISREKGYFDQARSYLSLDRELSSWEVVHGWSVDTCQDWLYGWGKAIDDWKEQGEQDDMGILQIPGDLRDVGNLQDFFLQLSSLARHVAGGCHFVIGDYKLREVGGKYLIDTYGTFPLLYNWFPDVATMIRDDHRIERPRSEFIAARVSFLKEMLVEHRRFAYEETTALLINALFKSKNNWVISKVLLGEIEDHTGERGFREALDQIERMERMMRLLWRVFHGGDSFDVDKYYFLDERSAAIRSAAMVTFTNFLRRTSLASSPT